MLDILYLKKVDSINNIIPLIIFVFTNIISSFYIYFKDLNLISNTNYYMWELNQESQINIIGKFLYTYYSYPFIIISLLLLVAMIGAIVLVLDLGIITRRQKLVDQHQRIVN